MLGQVPRSAVPAAVAVAAQRPLRRRERHDPNGRGRRAGVPLRLGADLPLRAGRRRLHHGDDEDRRDRDRHRPPRPAVPEHSPIAARRRADDGLRARRHVATACGRRRSASSPCMVPLALALSYDRMVAVSIIFLGAGTGVLCSTVNPFATGVASDAAGISISDGTRPAARHVDRPGAARRSAYVLWYGGRVRKDPTKSLVSAPVRWARRVTRRRGSAAAHGPPEGDAGDLLRRRS